MMVDSGLDILPSLVALAGRDISGALPGSNIFDGFFSGHALVESDEAWAFLQDNYKLIVSGEKALVFDLAADPEEQHDLAAEMTERSRALLTGAIQTRTAMTSGLPGDVEGEEGLDAETLDRAWSGYFGDRLRDRAARSAEAPAQPSPEPAQELAQEPATGASADPKPEA